MSSPLKPLGQILRGAFCRKNIDNVFEWIHAIEQDGHHAHIW